MRRDPAPAIEIRQEIPDRAQVARELLALGVDRPLERRGERAVQGEREVEAKRPRIGRDVVEDSIDPGDEAFPGVGDRSIGLWAVRLTSRSDGWGVRGE